MSVGTLAALLVAYAIATAGSIQTASAMSSGENGKIAFERGQDIWVMNPDGSAQANLTASQPSDREPDWSPDGKKIAFTSNIGGNREIFVINADGIGITRITHHPFLSDDPRVYSQGPDWSPSGSKLVFSYGIFENGPSVYTMNADGSGGQPTLLAAGEDPDWGAHPQPSPSQQRSTLSINAVSKNDGSAVHVYAKVLSDDGTVLLQGYTPMNFTGDAGTAYAVSMTNYLARDFDHWQDNSTDRRREVTLPANNMSLTAFYDTGSSKSGYTQLTYDAAEKPDLTVNATLLNGSASSSMLHTWTIIKMENPDLKAANNTATYTVAASNYGNKVFDHWEDGTTHRIRTLTISADATITAYYRMAG